MKRQSHSIAIIKLELALQTSEKNLWTPLSIPNNTVRTIDLAES
jgi:hypothetical protein